MTLKTGLTAKFHNFRFNYLFTHVREHFSDATNAVQVANATRGIIPTYSVMDISASYQFKWLRLQAGVNNLTDNSYFTRRATGYPGPGIIPASPRSFYVALRFRFASGENE
jgi:Fe(3+) dicitrate transport protein